MKRLASWIAWMVVLFVLPGAPALLADEITEEAIRSEQDPVRLAAIVRSLEADPCPAPTVLRAVAMRLPDSEGSLIAEIRGLVRRCSDAYEPILLGMLHDPSRDVQEAGALCAASLVRFNPETRLALCQLGGNVWGVYQALNWHGAPPASEVAGIVSLLAHEKPGVRSMAITLIQWSCGKDRVSKDAARTVVQRMHEEQRTDIITQYAELLPLLPLTRDVVVGELMGLARHPSSDVRSGVIRGASCLPLRWAKPILDRLAADRDWTVRQDAQCALLRLARPIDLLRHSDSDVRVAALERIQPDELGDPALRRAVLERLHDADVVVRVTAAVLLAGSAHKSKVDLVPILVQAAGNASDHVRAMAAVGVGRLAPPCGRVEQMLIRLMSDRVMLVRSVAVESAGLCGCRTPGVLRVVHQRIQDAPFVSIAAAESLIRLTDEMDEALRVLMGHLTNEDPRIRAMAANALGKVAPVGRADVLSALRRALKGRRHDSVDANEIRSSLDKLKGR